MEEDFVPYKDISELKRELAGMKGKKDISANELYNAVERLSQAVAGMLEVFGAAAEQMKLEEKGYESEAKKHEMIISKLDKLIEQNRTIAEGMVAVVEMVKEKIIAPAKEREEPFFRQRQEPRQFPEPKPFMRPQQDWQQRQEPMMPRPQQMMPPQQMSAPPLAPPPMPTPSPPDFGMNMPPMEPAPPPDLDFPEDFGIEEEPKKKGLFGMFKK